MDLHLKGQVAVVTGGVAGIGSGISEALAGEGCNLVIADFRPVEQTAEYCKSLEEKFGIKAVGVWADVSKEECVANIYKTALDTFGTVDILCNNAGFMGPSSIGDVTVETIRKFESVTVEGMFMMCKEFVRLYREQKKTMGHIVITVSKSAFTTNGSGNPCYISTKGAQASFVRGLASEVGREGIWVNGVIPGYVFTEATNTPRGRERQERMNKIIPVGRETQPKEIGDVVAFLCSDRACEMMGVLLDVTGGCML